MQLQQGYGIISPSFLLKLLHGFYSSLFFPSRYDCLLRLVSIVSSIFYSARTYGVHSKEGMKEEGFVVLNYVMCTVLDPAITCVLICMYYYQSETR